MAEFSKALNEGMNAVIKHYEAKIKEAFIYAYEINTGNYLSAEHDETIEAEWQTYKKHYLKEVRF